MARKEIAVVGYGSAALILLKTLQDLPKELREGWRVTIFERREAFGGQWLPDDTEQDPYSSVPLTGLYPDLRTNTPVHMMTYPHSPFPDETDLFPHWKVVLKYLNDYAQQWGLYDSEPEDWQRAGIEANGHTNGHTLPEATPLRPSNTPADAARRELPRRMLCNRELYSASWKGSTEPGKGGRWEVVSRDFPASSSAQSYMEEYDAIIDVTGHLVHPLIPHFPGQEEWLKGKKERRIIHSAFYRGPEAFKGETVVIVGAGPSGLDGSMQIARTAKKIYHAVTPSVILPPHWPFERRGRLSHLTKDGVVFSDGTQVEDVDCIYLGTGFIIRYEYLERGGMLERRPGVKLPDINEDTFSNLISTDLYVRPMFEHTASFAANHGPASLFWCGNVMSTSYRFSNAVQSALIAWLLAKPDILPSRDELVRLLKEDEARTVALGRVVERTGHRQGAPWLGESEIFQRRVLAFLESHGIQAGSAKDQTGLVMEPWREEVRKDFWQCMRGWKRLEKEGKTKELLKGVSGEEGYAKLSRAVIAEQKVVEKESNRDPAEIEISGWD